LPESTQTSSFWKVTSDNWPRLRSKIVAIERVSFVQSIRDNPKTLAALAQSSSSIFLALQIALSQDPIGYVAADVLEKFADIPNVSLDINFGRRNTIYIASVAILPEWRHRGFGIALQRECLRRASARGLTRATAHIERGALRRMGLKGRSLSRFRNWYGTGRTFEYVELPVE
jgi:GNAT superfamily N-acetyltransferase